MCYLVAKKFNEPGCIAVEAKRGKELAELVTCLGKSTIDKGIQIVTVSSMEAYEEYSPYTGKRSIAGTS